MKPPTSWKNAEREVAKLLGGKRHINYEGTNSVDVDHEIFDIEVKLGYGTGAKQRAWLKQANKGNLNKLPIVVWKPKNIKYEDAIVLIKLKDFIKFNK